VRKVQERFFKEWRFPNRRVSPWIRSTALSNLDYDSKHEQGLELIALMAEGPLVTDSGGHGCLYGKPAREAIDGAARNQ
jgi:hypothetical protein